MGREFNIVLIRNMRIIEYKKWMLNKIKNKTKETKKETKNKKVPEDKKVQ